MFRVQGFRGLGTRGQGFKRFRAWGFTVLGGSGGLRLILARTRACHAGVLLKGL